MSRKERRAAARKAEQQFATAPATTASTPEQPESAASPLFPEAETPTAASPANPPVSPTPETEPTSKPPISEARLNANRQNSQSSTGPTSEAGKAKVATNAVKTALTGRTVLLPFDNVEAYNTLLADYQKTFQPVGPIEIGLVQSLVDTAWRLERIPALEYALLEMAYNQLGHENAQVALNTPEAALEMHFRQLHEKEFRNLHIQENRLVRRRDREMKELRLLQETRKAQESEDLKQAAQAALVAEQQGQPFDLKTLGFDFSSAQFAVYMARLTPAMRQNLIKEALPKAA